MKRKGIWGIVATVAVISCCAVLAGCSGMPELPFGNPFASLFETTSVADARAAKTQGRTPALAAPDLVTDGVLTVGLQTGSVGAPFIISDANGVLHGMDIDVASALADELGVAVRFVAVPDVITPLAASSCDIVMDVSADHAGGATVVGGYYESAAAFFHHGAQGVVDVAALGGTTVGLQQNSVSEGVLNRTALVMTQRTYDNLNDAFDALRADTVTYVLCDAYPGAYLAAGYDDVTFAGALNAPVSVGVAVAAEKVNMQALVKQALDTVSANGVMDIIRARWIGGMPSITAADEIQNVPGAVGGEPVDIVEGTIEMAGDVQDGSTAGSNAVTV